MRFFYRLEDLILSPIANLLDGLVMSTLARLIFIGTLAAYYWKSAFLKLSVNPNAGLEEGAGWISSLISFFVNLPTNLTSPPSLGAYAQIFPKQMEAVGFDPSQLSTFHTIVVAAGTWGEIIVPFLIIIGLFTRAAALAMVVFVVVQSVVDIIGHGADAATRGAWFDGDPGGLIFDQRAFWIFLLLYLVMRGAGPLSVDRLLNRAHAN
jgi:putative oxidoreductase